MNNNMAVVLFHIILVLFGFVSGLKDPICALKPASDVFYVKSCYNSSRQFSYYVDKKECLDFVYSGCGGNANRFESKSKCEDKCKE
uniref:Male accessory gland serine protease inhibitor-like n=1 Tax=Drosophila rhopaloa TaxID=1041015 RepID=A0A6P4FQV1_DRORH